MAALDKQIGDNVARLRREKSQREVAAEMKRRGWKWSHVTLVSIESGERPLRLSEAVDLAAVLSTDVRLFFEPTGNVAWNQTYEAILIARRKFQEAAHAYGLAVIQAVGRLGDVELTEQQEAALQSELEDTPLDIASSRDVEELLRVADDLNDEILVLEDLPDREAMVERLRRSAKRLERFSNRWHAQARKVREVDLHGQHPEAP